MYHSGQGVDEDDAQAMDWYRKAFAGYRKAAEQGKANAQFSLGEMYRDGRGVARDEAQARYWFRKATEQGNSEAQDNLDQMK